MENVFGLQGLKHYSNEKFKGHSLLTWEHIQEGIKRVHVKCRSSFFSENILHLEYLQVTALGTLNDLLAEQNVGFTVALCPQGPVRICA